MPYHPDLSPIEFVWRPDVRPKIQTYLFKTETLVQVLFHLKKKSLFGTTLTRTWPCGTSTSRNGMQQSCSTSDRKPTELCVLRVGLAGGGGEDMEDKSALKIQLKKLCALMGDGSMGDTLFNGLSLGEDDQSKWRKWGLRFDAPHRRKN